MMVYPNKRDVDHATATFAAPIFILFRVTLPNQRHKSMTMSRSGCEQHTRRLPSAGWSSGSGP